MQETHYNDGRVERKFYSADQFDLLAESMRRDLDNPEVVSTRAVKIGRNDPCPCGSGAKFKRCCAHKIPKAVNS